jgi:putative ABC transport system permease protein
MALGASPSGVLTLVIREGARMAAAGVVVGLSGAFVLTRHMAAMLFGISALDPLTFAIVSLLLGAVAIAASYVPARRATRVEPAIALRSE